MLSARSCPIFLLALSIAVATAVAPLAQAQEQLPWRSDGRSGPREQTDSGTYSDRSSAPGRGDVYVAPDRGYGGTQPAPGQSYTTPPDSRAYGDEPPYGGRRRHYEDGHSERSYSPGEITAAGHRFFGSVSKGLASVIEHAFKSQGRPNGYILGEDAGGAFVAGLRYGEGVLYTKDAGTHRVFWQGPSIGYDAGAEGSRVMVLVYNLRDPHEIYRRFGGVAGSAYVIGGVGLTFQANDHIVLAPIRSGVGLRLGANVGYLKYTPAPTWNPF